MRRRERICTTSEEPNTGLEPTNLDLTASYPPISPWIFLSLPPALTVTWIMMVLMFIPQAYVSLLSLESHNGFIHLLQTRKSPNGTGPTPR